MYYSSPTDPMLCLLTTVVTERLSKW